MNFFTILFIAVGLAMDAFAVSIASGVKLHPIKSYDALKIALFFGSFQFFMPLIGWSIGIKMHNFIQGFDHWVAFGLLFLIGCKMIYESIYLKPDEKNIDPKKNYILLLLSIATSVDALAVGLSFAFLKILIITPVIIIGIITFLISLIGCFIGSKFGHFFENKAEIIGGFILIGIGLKILAEHMIG